MWKADEDIVRNARDGVVSGLAKSGGQLSASEVLDLARNLGTLVMLDDQESVAERLQTHAEELIPLIEPALETLEDGELDGADEDASMALDDLESPESVERATATLVSALEKRERVELIVIGARQLLSELELPESLDVSRSSFDDLLRPEAWRLVALNADREKRIARYAPQNRHRMWWWFEGVTINPSAIESLSVSAGLLATFPAARVELDRLIEADHVLAGRRHERSNVVSFADRLRKRRLAKLAIRREGKVAAAAADSTAVKLFETDSLVISADESFLIVDYQASLAPPDSQNPRLETSTGTVVEFEPHMPGRYRISLDQLDLQQSSAVAVLPHQAGEVRYELNLDE